MRNIKYIVIHTTATSQDAKVNSILRYWKEKRGWKNPGYHFIIEPNGTITQLQPLNKPSNGVKGYNSVSINISYIGGIDDNGHAKDTRTKEQYHAMAGLVKALHGVFPNAKIKGHKDFPNVTKACPCFNVENYLKEIGI